MKNVLRLTLLILFFTAELFGQDCKPYNTSVDEQSGKTYQIYGSTLSTFHMTYNHDEFKPYLFLANDGSASYIALQLNFSNKARQVNYEGREIESYKLGSAFELMFENGESFYVKSTEVESTEKGLYDIIINLSSRIKDEDLEMISKSKIDKIKVLPYLDNEDFFFIDIKKRRSKKLFEQFSCFYKMGFDNTKPIANPRKAESLMKLGDTYILKGKYNKAVEYYSKSIDAYSNYVNNLKLMIAKSAKSPNNVSMSDFEEIIDSIRSGGQSDKNIRHLESILNKLIQNQPENEKLEEIMLLLLE